jgi:hypothetical protein
VKKRDFIDRHATMLTIIAMAVLILVPSKLAYDASGNAKDAGDTATDAAHKASHAVVRLENERRARIYDQNGIDHYFCGKSMAIERILGLLLTASLAARPPTELTPAQLRAREVFEQVQGELKEAPQCEVLIPKPPKPKKGESRRSQEQAEAHAEKHPSQTAPLVESGSGPIGVAPTIPKTMPHPHPSKPGHEAHHGSSGGAGGHQRPPAVETPTPEPAAQQTSPESTAPQTAEASPAEVTTPVETPVTTAPEESTGGNRPTPSSLGEVVDEVGKVVGGLCTTANQLLGLCH